MEKVAVIKDEPVSFGQVPYPGWAEPGLWTCLQTPCLMLSQFLHFRVSGSGEFGILCPSGATPLMPLGLGDLLSRVHFLLRCMGAAGRGRNLEAVGEEGRGEQGQRWLLFYLGSGHPSWASQGPQPGMGPVAGVAE